MIFVEAFWPFGQLRTRTPRRTALHHHAMLAPETRP